MTNKETIKRNIGLTFDFLIKVFIFFCPILFPKMENIDILMP